MGGGCDAVTSKLQSTGQGTLHGEWGLLFLAVHRLLIEVASLVAKHGLLRRWALLQGIFPTQGSNWCLLHLTGTGRRVLYH